MWNPIPCRLCGEKSYFRFVKIIMESREVGYFECTGCRSLQTEEPTWLDVAYRRNTFRDVGRVQRGLLTALLCAHVLGKTGTAGREPCLDWGGAEGLFCRFMRDRGFDFFVYDKYASSIYCVPYSLSDPLRVVPSVITAFEVFEHLPEPAKDLAAIFGAAPRCVLFSTELYMGQGEDWVYLSVYSGRHVFFYSPQAMQFIADRFGYRHFQLQTPLLQAFVTHDIWQNSELEAMRQAWEILLANRESLAFDASQSLVDHLMGDAWQHVHADYLRIRLGSGPGG